MSYCGYIKLRMDRARSRWLIAATSTCIRWSDEGIRSGAAWVAQGIARSSSGVGKIWYEAMGVLVTGWYSAARILTLLAINLFNVLWLLITQCIVGVCRLFNRDRKRRGPIEHVFVLMLENRSFDHMLGFSGIQGIDALSGQPTSIAGVTPQNSGNPDAQGHIIFASSPADWAMPHDPGHEFEDVQEQLCGAGGNYANITNSGFVTRYSHLDPEHPAEIMKCYAPEQLPVITTLAREFAVCDHWFSSVPGPTWPNRFFIHAASSGGLDHSPSRLDAVSSVLFDGYKFANGTIYDRLDDEDLEWLIVRGDAFPQALAISGMTLRALEGNVKDFDDFLEEINSPTYSAAYTFIEPNYGRATSNFTCGNSQHPLDDVTRGERLLKEVYEAIRNSPHWEKSVLIITYDEHGGFFDHVPPPRVVAPGDAATNPENTLHNFDFTQLGVRVPAVVVSPLIPKNTIDHTTYDHTSALATLELLFGLQALTQRDKHANALLHLFSLTTPRADTPSRLPEPANSGIRCEGDPEESASGGAQRMLLTVNPASATKPLDSSREGFLHIALLQDLQHTSEAEKAQKVERYRSIHTRSDAAQYMHEVRQKVKTNRRV